MTREFEGQDETDRALGGGWSLVIEILGGGSVCKEVA